MTGFSLKLPLLGVWITLLALLQSSPAYAERLRWGAPGEILSLDPHAQNESLTNSLNAHLYERLVARDENLAFVPGLAHRWEQLSPLHWRFHLRTGIAFHEGQTFSADDVVFSVVRAQHPLSGISQYARSLGTPLKADNNAVDFKLEKPNPVFLDHLEAVAIMNQEWSRSHGVTVPLSLKAGETNHARHNANGTGPFRLKSRQPDVETTLIRHDKYWQKTPGNVDELVFAPISNAATRTAALLKDEVDLVNMPAKTDLERLAQDKHIVLQRAVENRVVFLGMDQHRDELLYSNIKGKNPLKDLRVRQALSHALDLNALQKTVWRDQAIPTGCMLPSAASCENFKELDQGIMAFDPIKARQLLNQAGYDQGFDITLDCPNDRGMDDPGLCVAMAAMWAKVGIRAKVQTMPRAQYFPKLERFDTSLYLLSWGGADIDAQPTMDPLMRSAGGPDGAGADNYGRFSDPQLDTWIATTGSQSPSDERTALVKKTLMRHQDQRYHLVLLRQKLTWAMRDRVTAKPAANNHVRAWLVRVQAVPVK